jgi:hypothetical protein
VDPEATGQALALLQAGKVRVNLKEGHPGIYVKTVLTAGPHTAVSLITDRHDHLESLTLDGQRQEAHPLLSGQRDGEANLEGLEGWLISLSLGEMVNLLEALDGETVFFALEFHDAVTPTVTHPRGHLRGCNGDFANGVDRPASSALAAATTTSRMPPMARLNSIRCLRLGDVSSLAFWDFIG